MSTEVTPTTGSDVSTVVVVIGVGVVGVAGLLLLLVKRRAVVQCVQKRRRRHSDNNGSNELQSSRHSSGQARGQAIEQRVLLPPAQDRTDSQDGNSGDREGNFYDEIEGRRVYNAGVYQSQNRKARKILPSLSCYSN